MKRSEMVDKIRQGMIEGWVKPEEVLSIIEEAGMIPPRTHLRDCPDPDIQVYVANVDVEYWLVHGWDNEEIKISNGAT